MVFLSARVRILSASALMPGSVEVLVLGFMVADDMLSMLMMGDWLKALVGKDDGLHVCRPEVDLEVWKASEGRFEVRRQWCASHMEC